MRNRVHELYKEVCVPKPAIHFAIVDQEKGETVDSKLADNVLHGTRDEDIVVLFVT